MDTTHNTERQSFYQAIASNPEDDLPRLVFADYLEESGTTDLDAATVDFIRLSCQQPKVGKIQKRIPKMANDWLKANWKRLVPSVLDLSDTKSQFRHSGRIVKTSLHFLDSTAHPAYSIWRQRACEFHFRRGFLDYATIYYPTPMKFLGDYILADQPLAKVYDAENCPTAVSAKKRLEESRGRNAVRQADLAMFHRAIHRLSYQERHELRQTIIGYQPSDYRLLSRVSADQWDMPSAYRPDAFVVTGD